MLYVFVQPLYILFLTVFARGEIKTAQHFKEEYQVDHVVMGGMLAFDHHVNTLHLEFTTLYHCINRLDISTVSTLTQAHSPIHTLHGTNTDSHRQTTYLDYFQTRFKGREFAVSTSLYDTVTSLRMIKTSLELDLLRHINRVSSYAHTFIMHQAKAGMKEFQLESLFLHWSYYRAGCRHCSYTSICGAGPNGSVLHYGHAGAPNDRTIQEGDMMLLDMGGKVLFLSNWFMYFLYVVHCIHVLNHNNIHWLLTRVPSKYIG